MAIINTNFGTKQDKPSGPKILPEQYHHTLVDSKYTPGTSLLSNVTGTPVKVEYYRQNLGASEEQMGLQLDDIRTYQSYSRVHNLIIKFQGAQDFDHDQSTGESSEGGTAFVIFDLTPLMGDMWIMDRGDGRAGLYQITANPQIKAIVNDKVYEVEYKLLGWVTQSVMNNLNSKVIEELYYSKDSALNGGNAVITADDCKSDETLNNWMLEIIRYMFVKFYWNPEDTFKIPNFCENEEDGIQHNIYDPYLVKFLADTLPLKLIGRNKPISILNHQVGINYGYSDVITVWDLFYKEDWNLLKVITKEMYLQDRRDFRGTRSYGTFFNSKFDAIIINDVKNYSNLPGPYITYNWYYGPKSYGTEEIGYVFTDKFYCGSYGNDFEKLLVDVFKNGVVDKAKILQACKCYYDYPFQLQPYYGGLLVRMIIKAKINNAGYL